MTRPRPASRPPCRHRFAPRRRRTARPAHAADRRRAPERLLLAVLREPFLDRRPGSLGSALLTEATLVSRVSAVSCAENPSTSRRIRTARWFAGRSWRAAMKASSTTRAAHSGRPGRRTLLDSEGLVRVGLDPDRLHQRLSDAAVVDPREAHNRSGGFASAAARLRRARCWWRSDTATSAASSALERRKRLPGPQQGILQGVLGILDRAEHPVAVRVQLGAMGLDELRVGGLVTLAGGLEQRAIGDCRIRTHRFWGD